MTHSVTPNLFRGLFAEQGPAKKHQQFRVHGTACRAFCSNEARDFRKWHAVDSDILAIGPAALADLSSPTARTK